MQAYFGKYGGQYVAETLVGPLDELEKVYLEAIKDESFQRELHDLLVSFVGRETPMTLLSELSESLGGAKIYAKREDLAHTGAHKINNALAQALLAKRMGKSRIVAETGAGQHGVATATACAKLGLKCVVYMGSVDAERQAPNVQRMKLLGADFRPVDRGSKTLKDAINEAIRDWITNVKDTHYLLGSAVGPHPFPTIVAEFQSVIGRESRTYFLKHFGSLPDLVVACVGGGSNAIGMFKPFVDDQAVELVGVQAGGTDLSAIGHHSSPLLKGTPGILHGSMSKLLQSKDGQVLETHSLAPGLDYPAVGPEHCHLQDIGRAQYVSVSDDECLDAFQILCAKEGILAALETSHAVSYAIKRAPQMTQDKKILISLSGRGDKDLTFAIKAIEKRKGSPL